LQRQRRIGKTRARPRRMAVITVQPSRMSKRPPRCIGPRSTAIPPCAMGRTSGSAPLSICPWRFGIAAILISLPVVPIVRSRTAGNWDMPTPLPTPFITPACPRSWPEMSPPSTPAATVAWRSRVSTDSPYWGPEAGSCRAGPKPKCSLAYAASRYPLRQNIGSGVHRCAGSDHGVPEYGWK